MIIIIKSNVKWCDFIVRINKDMHVKRIQMDHIWWEQQIEKLREFYFSALLPELACPRQGKGGIREPLAEISDTQQIS